MIHADSVRQWESETAAMRAKIAELQAALAEARKDAERYRWLRDCDVDNTRFDNIVTNVLGEDWDAAIDDARELEK